MKIRFRKLPIPWSTIFIAAGILCILVFVQSYISSLYIDKPCPKPLSTAFYIPLVNFSFWAILAPVLYNIFHLFPHENPLTTRQKAIHVVIALAIVLLHEGVTNIMYAGLLYLEGTKELDYMFLMKRLSTIPGAIIGRLIEYVIIMGTFFSLDYYQEYRNKEIELAQKEKELTFTQLNALKMQLQPHFLFNTLNSISSLMDTQVSKAQSVVAKLGHLMRIMLDQDKRLTIPLSQELEHVKYYLDIEQTRFNDRLEVIYDIEEGTEEAMVPTMILQPLVENAFKHGFSTRTDSGKIEIRSREREGWLDLIVSDDGKGVDDPADILENPGIGIQNVQQRLTQMYRDAYQFEIRSAKDKGFTVEIAIPFHLEPIDSLQKIP